MIENEIVLEYKMPITIKLDGQALDLARFALNRRHVGTETIPLGKPVPEALQKAHHQLNMSFVTIIRLIVLGDGRVVVR